MNSPNCLDKDFLVRMLDVLERLNKTDIRAVIGLDGFVDEVVHVVDQRQEGNTFTRIQTISDYADRIKEGSGLSMNIEIVPITRKMGGNGPIYAYGLKKFGIQISYMGCIGEKKIHPIFQELAKESYMLGIAEPGMTDAMEFMDGKIIRSKLHSLNSLTWEKITEQISIEKLASLFDEAELLSLNNWTMLPNMSNIWKHIQQEVIPLMKTKTMSKKFFFDLADPRKRSEEDVVEALQLIKEFKQTGFFTILSLNLKEARLVGKYLNHHFHKEQDVEDLSVYHLVNLIEEYMQIDCVVIHLVSSAACCFEGSYAEVPGPYCKSPVLTTGAGDVFNAGFTYGILNQLKPEHSLLLGNAASGYYVRKGTWANWDELKLFLTQWLTTIVS